jgi:hypothetical protein
MWDFIDIREVRAAKRHRCDECGEEIAMGQKHMRHAGKNEGVFMTYRMCMACAEITQAYCLLIDEDGFPAGETRRVLTEDHGVTDLEGFLVKARALRAERDSAGRARLGRLARVSTIICDRCCATPASFVADCVGALDEACPGMLAIERALAADHG